MLQPGTPIGRYEIQRRLGRGGMGTVYVAHDPVLGRMVAIKLFASELDLPDAAERFVREARSAAALNHANIVTIFDFGDYAAQPYIVMEYIQGETLAEVIRRRAPFPIAERLRWLEELCTAVAYAHRGGIIHRDIKPTNLMVDRSGRLKVLDFGIARMLGRVSSSNTGLIGTPGYMAPEQIVGGTADARSDLFAVAVVCYELLAYAEAFPGDTGPTITHRILNEEPQPLAQLVPDLHPEVVAVVEHALVKDPAERLPSVDALRETIARVRRDLEQSGGLDELAVTVLRPRPATRPGSGPQQQRVGEAVLTPPPGRPATDREALASRRRAQIDGALEQARAFLARGELDAALEACVQALTLDDTHVGALELEQAIQAALARQRAGLLLEEARDELVRGAITGAQDLLLQARALDPEGADVRRFERDLRLARVEQERLRHRAEAASAAVTAAEQALQRGDVEGALASARQALDFDADSEAARAIEAEALRRLDEETGADPAEAPTGTDLAATVIAPAARTTPVPVVRTTPMPVARPAPAAAAAHRVPNGSRSTAAAALPFHARMSAIVAPLFARALAAAGAARARPARQKAVAAGVLALVVIAAVVLVGTLTAPPAAAVTGSLVLDAVPWATVAAIETADGTLQPLPSPASTPVTVTLPVGSYRVRLVGPPPQHDTREFTVDVTAAGLTAAPAQMFQALTAEQYFEPYLASPQAAAGEEAVGVSP